MQEQKKFSAEDYGEEKVYEMVMKKYKLLRNQGILESLEDIYAKQPTSRIDKENYVFSFESVKTHIEEKMNDRGKIQKILLQEDKILRQLETKNLKEVQFDNEEQLYSQKLKSGLPIFKSIQFLRYQDHTQWTQFFGQENPFITDQQNIDFSSTKVQIGKTKLFLEDYTILPKVNFQFVNQNMLNVKYERYPTLIEIQKRADVLAKLLMFNIYTQQHRKLKSKWKNDQNYIEMQKNSKKNKTNIEPQKQKEGDAKEEEIIIKRQVKKIWESLEERANIIAHEQFKQKNGQKAVQTKKSLEKLKNIITSEPNPKVQLKILVAYKLKKSW